MKKLLSLVMSLAISFAVAAQTENQTTRAIRGAVVDSNGNPLPGAIVSATGGAETALVESDGTFVLEIPIWLKSVTASYAGYKNKKMKPLFNQDMIFKLKKNNDQHGFLNINGGVTLYEGSSAPEFSLMGGLIGNVGFYIKAGVMRAGAFNEHYSDMTGGIVVVGVTKRIVKNFYAYLGIGYGSVLNDEGEYRQYTSSVGTRYYKYDPYAGMAFDGGFMYKIGKHFDVTVGYTHTTDFDSSWNSIPNLSLGYVF